MRSFPRYRIYAILGWLVPLLLSIYFAALPDIHWIWRFLLFLGLFPLFFLLTIGVYVLFGRAWNDFQRRIQKEKTESSNGE